MVRPGQERDTEGLYGHDTAASTAPAASVFLSDMHRCLQRLGGRSLFRYTPHAHVNRRAGLLVIVRPSRIPWMFSFWTLHEESECS